MRRGLVAFVLVAWALGLANAEPDAVKAGTAALREMRRGSLVAALQQQAATRSRIRRVRPGAERDLLRAIRLAPIKPKQALALLEQAEAKAKQSGVLLPAETVSAVRSAAQAFADARPPFVSPRDPALRRMTRRPEGLTVTQLHDYARTYAAHMRKYNGNRPKEVLEHYEFKNLKDLVKGEVSYWDVDPRQAEVIGLADASPFRTAAGKVRVFNHYGDTGRHQALVGAFGEPTGKIAAEMTSSYRTLLLFPEGGVPYMLKFSGEWFTGAKELEPHQVRISVERTLHMRDNPTLVPEPAGLIVGKPKVTVLYRPLPVPRNGRLDPGDVLLSAHVLNDANFASTPLGQKIFARRGSGSAWFRQELAPKLADAVYRSMTSSFAHLELHSQNIDVLVAADGSVREVFVKDLLDMMHDPALQSASGRKPVAVPVLRDVEWKNIGEPGAHKASTGAFYYEYLGQTTYPGDAPTARSELHDAVRDEVLKIARARLPVGILKRYPEYRTVFEQQHPLHDTLGGLRELLVKSGLQAGFHADERARPWLLGQRGVPLRSGPKAKPDWRTRLGLASSWTYGYVGEVPVAIRRDRSGLVQDYFFRFD